jgi:SAM-dependent methyltransferase
MPTTRREGARVGNRIYGAVQDVSYRSTLEFFAERSQRSGSALTATMFQDEELAAARDASEKAAVLPLLAPAESDTVLDVGCGNGRWAVTLVPKIGRYLGMDFSEGLIAAARARVTGEFHVLPAQELTANHFGEERFSLVLFSGILTYLNDPDVTALLARIAAMTAPQARIYVREPIAKPIRLTLDRFWSDDLSALYSAVYRTRSEYADFFQQTLAGQGFRLRQEGTPIDPSLENRSETEQRFFLFAR